MNDSKKEKDVISGRLKEIRRILEKTNQQMSKEAGIGAGTISGMENGNLKPNFSYLYLLAKKYDVNINWILTGRGPKFARGYDFEMDLGPFNYILEEIFYLLNHSDQGKLVVLRQMAGIRDSSPEAKQILAGFKRRPKTGD